MIADKCGAFTRPFSEKKSRRKIYIYGTPTSASLTTTSCRVVEVTGYAVCIAAGLHASVNNSATATGALCVISAGLPSLKSACLAAVANSIQATYAPEVALTSHACGPLGVLVRHLTDGSTRAAVLVIG